MPTPFAIGPVNAYLIDDDPLTLIDCGPAWTTSLQWLETALAEHGRRIEDIELVLITHQHVDHLGLAKTVATVSGADVACLDLLAQVLADFEAHVEADNETAAAVMRRHGVPGDVVDVLRRDDESDREPQQRRPQSRPHTRALPRRRVRA